MVLSNLYCSLEYYEFMGCDYKGIQIVQTFSSLEIILTMKKIKLNYI